MLTYVILLLVSVYLLLKWVAYSKYKRTMAPPALLDQMLLTALNEKGDSDAK